MLDVIRVPERALQGHLNWATFHFADIAHQRTGERPVFGNIGAHYSGSTDDAALNAAVARYAVDVQAQGDGPAPHQPGQRGPYPRRERDRALEGGLDEDVDEVAFRAGDIQGLAE